MDKKELKAAWSRAVNNKDYKPYKDNKYGNKIQGRINAIHYIVYNIIRQLPRDRGFDPITDGYKTPHYYLNMLAHLGKFEELLFPFEGTITPEEFKELL